MLKNITLSAEERLLQKARSKAVLVHRSLNSLFREWLEDYTKNQDESVDYRSMMKQLSYAKAGRKFNRDELNAR